MDAEVTSRTSLCGFFHVTDSHSGRSVHCVLALLLLEFVDASELQTCNCGEDGADRCDQARFLTDENSPNLLSPTRRVVSLMISCRTAAVALSTES